MIYKLKNMKLINGGMFNLYTGVWFMHCHIDTHLAWGFAMAFIVENGVGESETLLPPPIDLPRC